MSQKKENDCLVGAKLNVDEPEWRTLVNAMQRAYDDRSFMIAQNNVVSQFECLFDSGHPSKLHLLCTPLTKYAARELLILRTMNADVLDKLDAQPFLNRVDAELRYCSMCVKELHE